MNQYLSLNSGTFWIQFLLLLVPYQNSQRELCTPILVIKVTRTVFKSHVFGLLIAKHFVQTRSKSDHIKLFMLFSIPASENTFLCDVQCSWTKERTWRYILKIATSDQHSANGKVKSQKKIPKIIVAQSKTALHFHIIQTYMKQPITVQSTIIDTTYLFGWSFNCFVLMRQT